MRAVSTILCCAGMLTFAGWAAATPIQKGSSILAIQLTQGIADLATDNGGSGSIGPFSHSEMGLQLQYWRFMTEDYAFNLDAGVGYFKESDTPDPSNPLADSYKYTQNSWQVRIGGDRVAHITDRFHLFVGPGIQIWSGKYKVETSLGEGEGPSTTRYALTGRIGTHLKMGESFGLMMHIGEYFGYATAKDEGAKTKWLPSGAEGAAGFAFNF